MRLLVAACLAVPLLVLPAAAETAGDRVVAFNQVAAVAIEEHTVFLNCSALEPESHALILRGWQETIDDTAAILRQANVLDVHVESFLARAAPEGLLMRDRTFAEVIAFCARNGDWYRRYSVFDIILLDHRARDIFGE